MNIFTKIAVVIALTLLGVFIAAAIRFVRIPVYAVKSTAAQTITLVDNALSCTREAQAYRSSLAPILSEWSDAEKLANSSPRIALPPVVSQLQSIRRKMNNLTPGSCVETVHTNFIGSMDESIAGFLSFMSQEPDETVQRHFKTSTFMAETAVSLLTTLAK